MLNPCGKGCHDLYMGNACLNVIRPCGPLDWHRMTLNLQQVSVLSLENMLMIIHIQRFQLVALSSLARLFSILSFCISASLVHRTQRDQRDRPDGGAALVLPGRHPAVPAARGAVPQPGPSGRAGGIHGGPLHTVSPQLKKKINWRDPHSHLHLYCAFQTTAEKPCLIIYQRKIFRFLNLFNAAFRLAAKI